MILKWQDRLPFGKHKGKLVSDVLDEDPGYLLWLVKMYKDNNDFFCQLDPALLKIIDGKKPKPWVLYIYRCESIDKDFLYEKFWKIGITQSLPGRFNEDYDDNLARWYRRNFVAKFEFPNEKSARVIEQQIHNMLDPYRYQPSRIFGGYTECYRRDEETRRAVSKVCSWLKDMRELRGCQDLVRREIEEETRKKEKANRIRLKKARKRRERQEKRKITAK